MRYVELISESAIPQELTALAREIRGKGWEAAKRVVVSKTGSVRRGERFDDDLADAIFLRVQRTAQIGQYASEDILMKLGRNARRLEGDGTITLYRACPKGGSIRPGDFASDDANEAGYYKHGGNVIQSLTVPRGEVFQIDGSLGGGREYVYLPKGYVAPDPKEWFPTFRAFYDAVNQM